MEQTSPTSMPPAPPAPSSFQPPQPRQSVKIWVWILIVVIIAAAVGFGIWLWQSQVSAPSVKVGTETPAVQAPSGSTLPSDTTSSVSRDLENIKIESVNQNFQDIDANLDRL